ncbi:uncharacterized protein BDW70DRAFT_126029 [Aspergillus foveolatus]|uniref:uncharacterized protein n=1 Tax=Aspergillus foveolatus TaxID=210207 RepID=UPI003CCDE6E0
MAGDLEGDNVDWGNSNGDESAGESAGEGTQPDQNGQSNPMSSISEWADATATDAETITALDNPSASTTQATETSTYTSSASTTSFISDSTPSSTSIASADSDDGGSGGGGLSTTTKVAIAVPIAVVGAAILAAIIFFLLRRRRRQRQRTSAPGILTRQIDTSSSAFLPSQTQIAPVPAPGPVNRRALPSNNDNLPPPPPYLRPPGTEPGAGVDSTSSAAPVAGAAAGAGVAITGRDLNWRTSEERAREAAARPRSPFDRPNDNDDNVSVVSEINDREAMMRDRGLRDDDDDISSMSSFGGDEHEHRQAANRGS